MNVVTLFAHLPLPLILATVASVLIPGLSALLAKAHWDQSLTGALTLGLSTALGFLTEWAHAGAGFDWRAAVGTAAVSWLVAAVSQSKILSGTALESWLLSIGSATPATVPEFAPAPAVTGSSPEVAAMNTPQPRPLPPVAQPIEPVAVEVGQPYAVPAGTSVVDAATQALTVDAPVVVPGAPTPAPEPDPVAVVDPAAGLEPPTGDPLAAAAAIDAQPVASPDPATAPADAPVTVPTPV